MVAGMYRDPEMNYANVGAASVLGLAAHGFADGDDLAESGNAMSSEHHGDMKFAQAALVQAQLAGARSRPDIKAGYGFAISEDGKKFVNGMSQEGGRGRALLSTINQGDIAGSKGGFLSTMAPTIEEVINEGRTTEAGAASKMLAQLRADQPTLTNEDIGKMAGGKQALRLEESHRLAPVLEDELQYAAGDYSQAATDTKAQAGAILDRLKIAKRRPSADAGVIGGPGEPPPEAPIGPAPEGS